jgi:hypothetical protein
MGFGNHFVILSVKSIMAHLLQIKLVGVEIHMNFSMSLTFQAEEIEEMFKLGG